MIVFDFFLLFLYIKTEIKITIIAILVIAITNFASFCDSVINRKFLSVSISKYPVFRLISNIYDFTTPEDAY